MKVRSILKRLEDVLTPVFRLVTAALLFVLMILTCVDVLGRYFFNRPVYGGLELTEITLAMMIFCALPMVSYRGEHVAVDIVTFSGRRTLAVQHVLTNLAGAVVTGVLARQLWFRGMRLERAGETTIQIEIPMYYVTYAMSMLMAATALTFLLRAFRVRQAPTPLSGSDL